MKVTSFTKTGNKATSTVELDQAVFGVATGNHNLLKQAYQAYLANGRIGSANVKNRGDVRGGGRKPWKQKGTGRARVGSIRSPLWRSGGSIFGPTGGQNHTKQLPAKAKRTAIRQALSIAATDNKVSVIEQLNLDGKTKDAYQLFAKLGLERRSLVVVENKSAETTRATNNLPNVKLVAAKYLNVYDVLNADHIVIEKSALTVISNWLAGEESK